MKITNVILTKRKGGAEQVLVDYAQIFEELGHDISFLVREKVPFFDNLLQISQQTSSVALNFGYFDLFAINKIVKIIKEFDSDIIVAHNSKAISLLKRAIKKIDKPIHLIAVNHSMNVKRSIGCDLILNVNKKIFYKTIDSGQPYDKSFVIYNALKFDESRDEKYQSQLSLKDSVNLGVIGRFNYIKNFSSAIKALSLLNKQFPDKFYLKIAGDGEEEVKLKKLVKDLKLEQNVEFLGWVENQNDFFDEIDIFLLPSIRETFGLVVVEAMKNCKPIIATKTVGPTEILRDGFDAIMINNNLKEMPQEICDAVLKIINDDKATLDMVNNAYDHALNNFSQDILKRKLQDILKILVKSKIHQN